MYADCLYLSISNQGCLGGLLSQDLVEHIGDPGQWLLSHGAVTNIWCIKASTWIVVGTVEVYPSHRTELYHCQKEPILTWYGPVQHFKCTDQQSGSGAEQGQWCCAGLEAATPQGPAQFQGCRVSITVQTPREQEASPLEISRSATSISKLYFSMSRDLYKGWLSVHSPLVWAER